MVVFSTGISSLLFQKTQGHRAPVELSHGEAKTESIWAFKNPQHKLEKSENPWNFQRTIMKPVSFMDVPYPKTVDFDCQTVNFENVAPKVRFGHHFGPLDRLHLSKCLT